MIQLTPNECRVLGVLIEKAQTTPAQYPLSLNAIVTGCNQKSNRHPVVNFDENRVLDAIDLLQQKELVQQVSMSGSRVPKFRHLARQVLDVETPALVVLAELMLRGPQTVGELRTRASRMHQLESLEVVANVLDGLMGGEEPMAKRVPPLPGSRAERFAQLLCPDLHPLNEGVAAAATPAGGAAASDGAEIGALTARIEKLEGEVASLKEAVAVLTRAAGVPNPGAL
jgi:uncharacterized protein YceH (UPF0502 family)